MPNKYTPYAALGKATTIGAPRSRNAITNSKQVPTLNPATRGTTKLAEAQETLYDNPAIQALQLLINPTGPKSAIGPLPPDLRKSRYKELLEDLLLDQSIGISDLSTETYRRTTNDLAKHPGLSGYLNSVALESNPRFNGSISGVETTEKMKQLKATGQDIPNSMGMEYRIRPRRAKDTTTRHEFGHVARSIKNPEGLAAYTKDKTRYGYWMHPEEIRARAIGQKPNVKADLDANRARLGIDYDSFRKWYMQNEASYPARLKRSILKGLDSNKTTDQQMENFGMDFQRNFPELDHNYWLDLRRRFRF